MDTTNTPPDIDGFSKAWKVDLDTVRKRLGIDPAKDGGICEWIVYAPWSHPIWPYVCVIGLHLRHIDGMPDATIHLRGATHEIMVWAMDPDKYPPHLDGAGPKGRFLHPCNFAGQFIEPSDDAARNRIETVVREICMGTLNPDTDGVQQWIARFGDHGFKQDYREAKPGTIKHALMQGGSVIVTGDTAIHVQPGPPPGANEPPKEKQ